MLNRIHIRCCDWNWGVIDVIMPRVTKAIYDIDCMNLTHLFQPLISSEESGGGGAVDIAYGLVWFEIL